MPIVERHTSPDGLLQLIDEHDEHDDWIVGFDGFAWHTHGDILDWSAYAGTPRERAFADDVVALRWVIMISRVDGVIDDVCRSPRATGSSVESPRPAAWHGGRL